MVINSFNNYCKARFGEKVYKLSLDGGFTCPNRDGTLGYNGCIFCNGGSGRFAVRAEDITGALEKAKEYVKNKKASKYIAYFQSYSGTYAPVEQLKNLYLAAIKPEYIVALDIATRPDCLSEEVLNLLCEINKIKPVFVELGLQTIHPGTARFIRRGYELSVYDRAVKELHRRSLNVVTHLILGLPGESENDMLESVKYVCDKGTDGIKLHMLNVLEGTDLAPLYLNGAFSLMGLEEYVGLICKCVKIIPESVVIHRLTGDGDKRLLVAPEWVKDKKRVLNAVNAALKDVL